MMASKALFALLNTLFLLAFFRSASAISIARRRTGEEMTRAQVHDNTFNTTWAQVHDNTFNTTRAQVHNDTFNTTWAQVHVDTDNTHGNDVTTKDVILETNTGLGLDLVEGDIIEDRLPEPRTVTRDGHKIWANRTIPYIIELSVEPAVRQYIQQAIEEFHRQTCLHWTPRTTQRDFIVFTAKTGCSSMIGKSGGAQNLSLTTPCAGRGTAMHEMMHALGFFHEHSRPDREQWVQILLQNVEPGKESNFDRQPADVVDTLGVAYDYGSIMHYASTAFSANGLPTILPLRDVATVLGQREGLSGGDLQRITQLYGCATSVISWSSWRDVSQCDVQCRQLRNRVCLNPDPRVCRGYSQEFVTCPSPCRPALSLGCWANKPWNGSAVPSLEGLHPDVTGDFRSRPSAVRRCADAASSIGSLIFAVQRGGECLAGSGAELTFSVYGPSSECQPGGRGGASAMEVYTFTEEVLKTTSTSTTPTTSEATPLNVLPDLTTPLSTFFESTTRDVPIAFTGWSSWRSLTQCDRLCQQIRYRLCLSLDPRTCQGHSLEILNCSSPCVPSRETTTSASLSSTVTSNGTAPSGQSQPSSPSPMHTSPHSHLLPRSSAEFSHASFTRQTSPKVTQATPRWSATLDQSTNATGQTEQSPPRSTQATPHLTAFQDHSTTSTGQTEQSPPRSTQTTPHLTAAQDHSTTSTGQTEQSPPRSTQATPHLTAAQGQSITSTGQTEQSPPRSTQATPHLTAAQDQSTTSTGQTEQSPPRSTQATPHLTAAQSQSTTSTGQTEQSPPTATQATPHSSAAWDQSTTSTGQTEQSPPRSTQATPHLTAAQDQSTTSTGQTEQSLPRSTQATPHLTTAQSQSTTSTGQTEQSPPTATQATPHSSAAWDQSSPTAGPTDQSTSQEPVVSSTLIGWSSWRNMTQCDVQCRQFRFRLCLNPDSRLCQGHSQEMVTCPAPCRPALSLGCWTSKPWNGSAVVSLEGLHPDVIGDFRSQPSAVRRCADVAGSNGSSIFAVQNGGLCLTGPLVERNFSLFGRSSDCQRAGRGGPHAMEVYTLSEGVDGSWGIWTPWTLCSRCCGGGRKYRFRKCDSPPRFGQGVDCQGLHQQNTSCNRHRCQASLSCGPRLYTGDPGDSGFINLQRYQNCMTCEYLVTSRRPSDTVSVRVTYLQLEQSDSCVYDALSIYDSSNPIPGRLLGTYCGRNHFPTLQSSGNALLVTLTSDSTIPGLGFTIVYSINNGSRKACLQPAVPSGGNLTGSNFVGDTVLFSCRAGSHLQGQSTITCVNQPGMAVWSHGFPICVAGTRTARDVTDRTIYECTFEGHLCGFRLDLGQTGRSWLLVKGNNSADLFKSAFDRFNSPDGHFMYVESKRVRLGGDVARMSTLPLDLSDLHHCLTFWYRLRGDQGVQLEVSAVRSGQTRGSTVWISKGNNQGEWKKAKVELQTLGDILIVFQALLGSARSSAAVDDVIISSGRCNRK